MIAFVVGGTTYEEARGVADLNTAAARSDGWAAGMRFLLGGSGVLNSHTFLSNLAEMSRNERASA